METEVISYKLKELSELEGRHPVTIKNNKRYIKVRIETGASRAHYKAGETKSPYTYRYIRLEDIKKALKGKVEISFNP